MNGFGLPSAGSCRGIGPYSLSWLNTGLVTTPLISKSICSSCINPDWEGNAFANKAAAGPVSGLMNAIYPTKNKPMDKMSAMTKSTGDEGLRRVITICSGWNFGASIQGYGKVNCGGVM